MRIKQNENCYIEYDDKKPSYEELLQEIDRLNNIINELEEWLEYKINIFSNAIDNENLTILGTFKATLDKLKELKEKEYE